MTTKKETFVPIKLPSHKSFQGKNLTGTECFVYNLAADIHANIQQWNSFHIQGVNYLKNIIQVKRDKNYSVVLQDLCDKLENVCDNLDSIVVNLEQIKNQLTAITALQETANKLFITWPINKFGEIAETIYEAYHKEAKQKRNLLENIAHHHTESWKMFHLAAWVHQPLLPENLTILLNSLLVETGHR
ncbi:Cyclin-dependent kinase 2-interacting protein [Camponotus floridanus]|uniref:Cyclin-dependent kinase 2-interacting protein n=1 Tax=Camponotus floridanus TaxID=104421 RepID=E2A805_CAMFO|nr:cyclin-dependent kinase 2-interacting protein [Camponotus floridanus]EFN70442.1 Cyclin-dependent kinase 2-interacting protein [Camponotus floridanus]